MQIGVGLQKKLAVIRTVNLRLYLCLQLTKLFLKVDTTFGYIQNLNYLTIVASFIDFKGAVNEVSLITNSVKYEFINLGTNEDF